MTSGITQPDASRSVAAAVRLAKGLGKQMRFAGTVAINRVLAQGLRDQKDEMRRSFHRPTPYVVNRGVVTQQAKIGGPLEGFIALDTAGSAGAALPAGKPLYTEVTGGERRAKRSEVLLQRSGILPRGWLTVVGKSAPRDGYGNLHIGTLLQILSWFRVYGERTRRGGRLLSNITDRGIASKRRGTKRRAGLEFFAIRPGDKSGLIPGIYRRQLAGRSYVGAVNPRPIAMLIFVSRAQYRQRYDFAERAEKTAAAVMPGAYRAALQRALATARL